MPWEQAGAAWDAGSWAPGLTGTPASLLSFSVPSFYFPITERREVNLFPEVIFKSYIHFFPSNTKNDTCLLQKVWKIQEYKKKIKVPVISQNVNFSFGKQCNHIALLRDQISFILLHFHASG